MTWTRCTLRDAASGQYPDVGSVTVTAPDGDNSVRIEFHMVSADCGGVPIVACVTHLPELVELLMAELEAKGSVCVPVSVLEDDGDDGTQRPN